MKPTIHLRLLFEPTNSLRKRLVEYAQRHSPQVALEYFDNWQTLSPQMTVSFPVCTVIDFDVHDDWDRIESCIHSGGNRSAVIVLSADADLSLARRVFAAGAFDCLSKPIQSDELIDSLSRAIDFLSRHSQQNIEPDKQAAIDSLTPREFQYFHKMMQGWSIKVLAMHYDVSVQTAAKHRARVLSKLNVENEVMLLHNYSDFN